jgi:hypothetical protein
MQRFTQIRRSSKGIDLPAASMSGGRTSSVWFNRHAAKLITTRYCVYCYDEATGEIGFELTDDFTTPGARAITRPNGRNGCIGTMQGFIKQFGIDPDRYKQCPIRKEGNMLIMAPTS